MWLVTVANTNVIEDYKAILFMNAGHIMWWVAIEHTLQHVMVQIIIGYGPYE